MADGEPIVLRQLEGDGLELVLEDASLPEQLTSASELRTVRTYYPGTNGASTQVMGTKDDDIVLQGQLRDTWIGAAGGALALWQTMRRMYLAQRYVELSWGSTFVRRGRLKRVEQTFTRVADIGFRLTFEVDEADEAEVVKPVAFETPTSEDLDTGLDELEAVLDDADVAVSVLNVIQGVI